MRRVFADTFYFLALLNKRDEAHVKAVEFAGYADQLVTTEWVLLELGDGLASSRRRQVFVQAPQEMIDDPNVLIVPLSMELQNEVVRLFSSRSDKEWSLTDCISFIVMQREGLIDALTGDHHFEQAGFVVLLK